MGRLWIPFAGASAKTVVFFIPRTPEMHLDPAGVYWALCRQNASMGYIPVLIRDRRDSATDHLERHVREEQGRRIALFGHGSPGSAGWCHLDGGLLLPAFWRMSLPYDLVYAHCCWGASVLNRPEWRSVMPHHVSFSSEVSSYLGSRSGRQLWVRAFAQIGKAMSRSRTSLEAHANIQAVFDRLFTFEANRARKSPGDVLNLMYLIECRDALTHDQS